MLFRPVLPRSLQILKTETPVEPASKMGMGGGRACVFLLAVMSRTNQYSDVVMYFVSYFLWLNLAAPVNLFLAVIPIGGVGGAFGYELRARIGNARLHR